jgi:hypothetical protein
MAQYFRFRQSLLPILASFSLHYLSFATHHVFALSSSKPFTSQTTLPGHETRATAVHDLADDIHARRTRTRGSCLACTATSSSREIASA